MTIQQFFVLGFLIGAAFVLFRDFCCCIFCIKTQVFVIKNYLCCGVLFGGIGVILGFLWRLQI